MTTQSLLSLLLAAALGAATSCARVDEAPAATLRVPSAPPAQAAPELQLKSISGEHSPGDPDYLEYYRSTCRIDPDSSPDPATLAPAWRNAREVTPEQAARLKKYRSTCNIR